MVLSRTRPGRAVRELTLTKDQSLNEAFSRLSTLGIDVLSMRNKVNRLEEIFMRLVEGRAEAPPGDGGTPLAVARQPAELPR